MAFSLPLWLVASAVIAGAAALYFLNERRLTARTLVVPFMPFTRSMPQGRGRKRPRWPLLLLLQCGALLLIIAAAAGLHKSDSSADRGMVIILDAGLGMQAQTQGDTRFEQARRGAQRELDMLQPSDPVWLIAAERRPRLVAGGVSGADVRRPLETLTVTDGSADVEAALDMARRLLAGHAGRIHLFTDRARTLYDAWDRKCRGDHPPVTIHRAGASLDNLAITGLSIYQSPLAADYKDIRAYITVRNYSTQTAKAVYMVTLDGRPVAAENFALAPQEQKTFTVQRFDGAGLLRASLSPEDALPSDNAAFGLIVPIRPVRLLVVGETGRLREQLQSALVAHPRAAGRLEWQLDFKTPAAVMAFDRRALDLDYDVIVFDGFRPDLEALRPAAALWNGDVSVSAGEDYYVITNWSRSHALMEYLENFNLLMVRAGAPAPSAPWIEPIIEGRLGGGSDTLGKTVPVLGAEVNEGRRAVYFGFDLKAYRLTKYQHLEILLLNTLRWLHPQARRPANRLVGEDVRLADLGVDGAFTLQKPGGALLRYAAGAVALPGSTIDRQGLYKLRTGRGEELSFVATRDGESDESDLTVDNAPLWESPASTSAARKLYRAPDYSWSHRAWFFALMFLIVEAGLFMVYGRRAYKARAVRTEPL